MARTSVSRDRLQIRIKSGTETLRAGNQRRIGSARGVPGRCSIHWKKIGKQDKVARTRITPMIILERKPGTLQAPCHSCFTSMKVD
jgi:hypothetical protein